MKVNDIQSNRNETLMSKDHREKRFIEKWIAIEK